MDQAHLAKSLHLGLCRLAFLHLSGQPQHLRLPAFLVHSVLLLHFRVCPAEFLSQVGTRVGLCISNLGLRVGEQ